MVQDLRTSNPAQPYFERVAVIGAGTMGNGIAQTFATYDTTVQLVDVDEEALKRGLGAIEKSIQRFVSKGKLTEGKDVKTNTRVLFTLGVISDKLKDWRSSVSYLKLILEIDPQHAHALNYLGYTYAVHEVELGEAERMILKALEILPGNGFIIDSLGWVYYKQGKFEQAVRELRRALELAPDDGIIWEHLGDALVAHGLPDEARAIYVKALSLNPDSQELPGKLDELQ